MVAEGAHELPRGEVLEAADDEPGGGSVGAGDVADDGAAVGPPDARGACRRDPDAQAQRAG